MVKFKDISLYFISKCCIEQDSVPLSELSPQKGYTDALKYFEDLVSTIPNLSIYATTITIGNKYFGKMSSTDQYLHMYKAIKKHVPFHGEEDYIYFFEYTKSGVVHAHGLTTVNECKFINSFGKFGQRNLHPSSYQKCEHIKEYIGYISKDVKKDNPGPPIHNITKRKLGEQIQRRRMVMK